MKGALPPILGIVLVGVVGGAMFMAPKRPDARLAASAQADEFLQKARRLLLEYDPQLNFETELREVFDVEDFELADEPNIERKYAQGLTRNTRTLQDALREVNNALAVSVGEVSMRQDGPANRLLGMIQHQQGLALAQRVSILRADLMNVRTGLQRQGATLARVKPDLEIVASSGIEDRIAEVQQQLTDLQQEYDTQQQLTTTLEDRVNRLRQELDDTREQSDVARSEMESLQDSGVDLMSANGLAEFERSYRDASDRYRFLVLQAQVLEFGSLENAAADDPATGTYEPILADEGISYKRGLVHYQNDLDIAQTTLANLQGAVDLAKENIADLEGIKSAHTGRAVRAQQAIDSAVATIEGNGGDAGEGEEAEAEDEEVGGELEWLIVRDVEIRELEDQAIKKFTDAARSFKTAVAGVGSEMNDARSNEPSDPARAAYHYSSVVKNQRPLQGHIRAQQAEAKLRQALVLVGRHRDALDNARVVRAMSGFFKEDEQLSAWEDDADETRTAAHDLITEAIGDLEKAKDEIADGNWIVAAEIGSAHYMLGILGDDLAAETAMMWYDLALEGREDKSFAAEYVRMRDYIERRSAD